MAHIEAFPIQPDFEGAMIAGQKSSTTRTHWCGDVGDTFDVFGHRFAITRRERWCLESVARDLWREEGVASPAAFKRIWTFLHPGRGWQPDYLGYVHHFILMGEIKEY